MQLKYIPKGAYTERFLQNNLEVFTFCKMKMGIFEFKKKRCRDQICLVNAVDDMLILEIKNIAIYEKFQETLQQRNLFNFI